MSYTIEFTLDLGDLKAVHAIANGTVDEGEYGRILVTVRKIVCTWPVSEKFETTLDVTHMVLPHVRATLEEQMEHQYLKAKYNTDRPNDYDRVELP